MITTKEARESEIQTIDPLALENDDAPIAVSEESVTTDEPAKPKSFAHGLNFYKLFWIFIIGCFLGVVIETLYCLATRHYFESRRGLIYGPFNLVYGIGALAMTVGLQKLIGKRDLWLFLGGFFIGSVFEYLCSLFQEIVFGTVSWEYGQMPLNLNGRINVLYSFFWGILALLFVKEIYPRFSRLIEKIPGKVGVPLTWVLVVFMIFNSLISGLAVYRMSQRHENIPASNVIAEFLDKHYPDERLQKIYANMTYVKEDT